MCLRNEDIDSIKEITQNCYITHPLRNDDTDDVLLDTANQLDLTRKDLIEWITSDRSWQFMCEANSSDLDVSDFLKEFEFDSQEFRKYG
jgi:hypothetical protein